MRSGDEDAPKAPEPEAPEPEAPPAAPEPSDSPFERPKIVTEERGKAIPPIERLEDTLRQDEGDER